MKTDKQDHGTAEELIDAAGRLFAVRGLAGVTTREISAEAGGIDISLIKYHFGGKDGLIRAVAQKAMSPLQSFTLENYYHENSGQLATRDGRKIFVSGMIEVIFNRFSTAMPNDWCKGFILQVIQTHGRNPMRMNLIEEYMKPMVSVFARVYREITGNDDFETALCWYLFITAQMFLYSGDTDLIDLLHPDSAVGHGFARRIRYFCTEQVLRGFGLLEETAK